MSQERLSMRKIEEILRLKYEAGLTHRAIAQSCSVSPSTVSEYVTHAKAAGLSWVVLCDMMDKSHPLSLGQIQ
jgi:DNA-binding transcriptional regulator LsrR (DeoR family)